VTLKSDLIYRLSADVVLSQPSEEGFAMDERASSSPATPDDLTATSYVPQLLGGHLTYSARDLSQATDTPIERVFQFWIALGFQAPSADDPVFSARDLDVFSQWHDLVESGGIDTATSRSLLRANSHLADRLALWQFEALVEDSMRRLNLDDTTARMYVLDHMREYIDVFQEMFTYSWRRQLEATLSRFDREVSQRGHEERHDRFPLNRCLGFVDMVSFTSSSTILGDALVGLIERFEEESRTAVIEEGGRVVKMIGDAILYIADDLSTGLRVVTALIERLNADDEIIVSGDSHLLEYFANRP